jgi:hypothetical protein
MTKAIESPDRRRARRLAAYATAAGLGAGIVTGTGVASAAPEPDAPSNGDPSTGTGLVGSTLGTVSDVVSNVAKRSPSDIPVVKTVTKASASLFRIATNHSLVTAR